MQKFLLFLSFFIISHFPVIGQNETNIWYFGSFAGLNFNSGVPVAITNGQLNSFEGCASIANNTGNLLFYSDGITIWNRNHVAMPNGTGLLGNWDATQSGVIVPKPGSTNIYYTFAVTNSAGPDGITYSEVDMNLALGNGDVTATKNVLLQTPSTEKLTAVKHCNKRDIWIVTHDWNSDTFRTFLITPAGINPVPVLSRSGVVHTGNDWNTNGYLKASPDGKKLALAACHDMNIFELFDFDNSTGIVSNAVPLSSLPSTYGAYGVEFSPDNKKLYGTTILPSRLIQFDLCAGSATAINSSRVVIDSASAYWYGALQLAPDNKIYLTRNNADSIGVINNPNMNGVACSFINNSIPLSSRTGGLGLPNFLTSYFNSPPIINSPTINCLTDSFYLTFNGCSPASYNSMQWNFGDPLSGSTNTSTISNPTHTFSSAGTYTITTIINYPCNADTLYKQINFQPILYSTSVSANPLCYNDSTGSALVSGITGGTFPYRYSWTPNGTTTPNITGLPAGNYTVSITDSLNCVNTSTINITQPSPLITVTAFPPNVCSGDNAILSASANGGTLNYNYTWQPTAGISASTGATVVFNSTSNSVYTVTVTDANGCTDSISGSINILPKPLAIVTGDTLVCLGDNAFLSASGGGTYTWSTGPSSASIFVRPTSTMAYTVVVTAGACSDTTSITVNISAKNINAGIDTALTKGETIMLQATGTTNYLWSTGETTAQINVSPSITTTYCVFTIDSIGCHDTDCVVVRVDDPCGVVFVPNAFSPNNDGNNDHLKLQGYCIVNLKFTIFNRWGEIVFETNDLNQGWDGKYKSKELDPAVFVYTIQAKLNNGEEIFKEGNISLIK